MLARFAREVVEVRQRDSKTVVSILTFRCWLLMLLVPSPVHELVAGRTVAGALVPNAQLSIKNLDTGVAEAVKSDALGSYRAPIPLPRIYEVAALAPWLATEPRTGVALTVGGQLVLNMTMRVAQISEKVQVTNGVPAKQARSSLSDVGNENRCL